MKLFINAALCILLVCAATACASAPHREKAILEVPKNETVNYEELLVKPSQYTTNGAAYHEKYHRHLIGIAHTIISKQKLSIQKNSLGFYFDKKENRKDKLYLGLDIVIKTDFAYRGASYEHIASAVMDTHLRDLLAVINSCASIFQEDEIVGMVIGFLWDNSGRRESISIWIDKNDVAKLENMKLTLKELIVRSFLTNTEGKIIRLPL